MKTGQAILTWKLSRYLRKEGFKQTYFSRGGGVSTRIFEKQVGDRKIDIQLWGDGNHRASHMLNGVGSTPPSDFGMLHEMQMAIVQEMTQTDQSAWARHRAHRRDASGNHSAQ
jgi:hypothetical protein